MGNWFLKDKYVADLPILLELRSKASRMCRVYLKAEKDAKDEILRDAYFQSYVDSRNEFIALDRAIKLMRKAIPISLTPTI